VLSASPPNQIYGPGHFVPGRRSLVEVPKLLLPRIERLAEFWRALFEIDLVMA
jgi:hypothetical protein